MVGTGGTEHDPTTTPTGTVIIGCGNLLRGDDGFGPILVRQLWEDGVGDHVELVDGGTAGMDVGFKMRGREKVVIVDAAATGSPPGTVFRVPAEELEDLPALEGLHSHQFRWDHALAFGRWLLKDEYPSDIEVFLVEAENIAMGAELSPAVRDAMPVVKELVLDSIGVRP
ncbi:MAG: hydrogenase maturation protease [Actinomycetota bacterium]